MEILIKKESMRKIHREFQNTGTEEVNLHFPSKYHLLLSSAFIPDVIVRLILWFYDLISTSKQVFRENVLYVLKPNIVS